MPHERDETMAKARTFTATKKSGEVVTVTTKLSDSEAIEILGGIAQTTETFDSKCAFEIHKLRHGFRCNEKMVAWGFISAERKSNPVTREGVALSPIILSMVRERKPLRIPVGAGVVKVSKAGPGSKHAGSYILNNDEPFGSPRAVFYGFATPEGVFTPARGATPEVVEAVTKTS